MKKAVVFLAAALLVLGSALPLAGYWLTLTLLRQTPAAASSDPGGSGVSSVPPAEPGALPAASAPPAGSAGEVLLQDGESGQTFTLSMRDYLIGAVASEMPVSWPDEALKAQAVACHSYILYCRDHRADESAPWLTVDPARRRGTAYQANYARLSALVDQVAGAVLYYDGAPAGASYFAISNGQTEASENVWGSPLPYLRAVDSSTDLTAQDYEVTVTLSAEQVSAALADALGIPTAGIDPSAWFGTPSYTPSGYVDSLPVCGQTVSGTALRSALGLRSACFAIRQEGGAFAITTRGYGHGVGLSQWGRSWLPRLSDGAGCAAGAGSSCSMAPSGSCTDQ